MPQHYDDDGYISAAPKSERKAGPNPAVQSSKSAVDANGDQQISDVEQRYRDLPPDVRQVLIAKMDAELATAMMMLMPELAPLLTRAMSATPDMVQGQPMTPGVGPGAAMGGMGGGMAGGPAPMPGGGGPIGAIRA